MAKKQLYKQNNKDDKDDIVSKWCNEINAYETKAENWLKRCSNILGIYTNERKGISDENARRFNIFWANIQTMIPAIYAKLPNPQIQRRFKDNDDVGRVSSDILERCTKFILDCTKANETFEQSVLDYLLCARATLWVRYEPSFKDTSYTENNEKGEEVAVQDLDYEEVKLDYVNYEDFGHTCAKRWDDVTAVWKKCFLTRKELIKYFGEKIGKEIGLNSYDKDESGSQNGDRGSNTSKKTCNRACVYEIWDKITKKVYWISKTHREALKIKDDFLHLKDFFPCPRPLYATITNNTLIPTPDYIIYQDQCLELNQITVKIDVLTSALRVAGVYDSNAQGLERLLNGEDSNILIPVPNWQQFSEKGGIAGQIQFMPIKDVALTLRELYTARELQKSAIYELTGISDLLRGDTNANETLGAQEIKSNYASMRFQDRRAKLSRYLRDAIQIVVEI